MIMRQYVKVTYNGRRADTNDIVRLSFCRASGSFASVTAAALAPPLPFFRITVKRGFTFVPPFTKKCCRIFGPPCR